MPGDIPRSYWDSCVFLAWINNEPERAGVVDSLLRSARAGEFEIITSVISVTEVALAAEEKQSGTLSQTALLRIDRLCGPPSPVKLVEVSRLIATGARDLMRQAAPDGLSLKPPDAIHLSTAPRAHCDEFLTYDPKLQKYAGLIAVSVKQPVSAALPLDFDTGDAQSS
jgi:predicted nucleic acid-binding protein